MTEILPSVHLTYGDKDPKTGKRPLLHRAESAVVIDWSQVRSAIKAYNPSTLGTYDDLCYVNYHGLSDADGDIVALTIEEVQAHKNES